MVEVQKDLLEIVGVDDDRHSEVDTRHIKIRNECPIHETLRLLGTVDLPGVLSGEMGRMYISVVW